MNNYESPNVEYVPLMAVKKLDAVEDYVDLLPGEMGLSDNTIFLD